MSETPRRRWFRFAFSLRTLFVLVTVFACWLTCAMHLINQRKQLREMMLIEGLPGTAPMGLWLLGEEGFSTIDLYSNSEAEARHVQYWFPEADVEANGGFDSRLQRK